MNKDLQRELLKAEVNSYIQKLSSQGDDSFMSAPISDEAFLDTLNLADLRSVVNHLKDVARTPQGR